MEVESGVDGGSFMVVIACRLDMLSSVCLSCSYLLRGLIPWMLVKYSLVAREGFGVVIMSPMNSLSEL